ncbi:MAG: DJ-1/PfpI family protein [Pseudomonadota bacterium]
MLVKIGLVLATKVANSLGFDVPDAMPLASNLPIPQFKPSPGLSLLARPGRTGIRTRRVAILIGKGVDASTVKSIYLDLLADGAIPRLVSCQLGKVLTTEQGTLDVEISLEAGPSVLYDAVIIADGEDSVRQLAKDANAIDFVRQQYRHCKPIMAIGAGANFLAEAQIPTNLPDGSADPMILVADKTQLKKALVAFKDALANHRSYKRETDPPLV